MITPALLVYSSLLERAQYQQLRDLAALQPGALDIGQIDQAMRAGVDKRLELAEGFLLFAENLQPDGGRMSEMTARNAVSRAYYAVHHAMRALLLFEEREDVDGHREAIEAVSALLGRNPAARAIFGEPDAFRSQVLELLAQRHLSDYYPYGTNAPREAPARFVDLAAQSLPFVRRVVEKTQEYIAQKEARVI